MTLALSSLPYEPRSSHLHSSRDPHRRSSFPPSEQFDTGDLILFDQPSWLMSPVAAVLSQASKRKTHSPFDHCGVLIRGDDQKLMVLEATQSGFKLRPFAQRLVYSMAREIVVRPLPVKKDDAMKRAAELFAKTVAGEIDGGACEIRETRETRETAAAAAAAAALQGHGGASLGTALESSSGVEFRYIDNVRAVLHKVVGRPGGTPAPSVAVVLGVYRAMGLLDQRSISSAGQVGGNAATQSDEGEGLDALVPQDLAMSSSPRLSLQQGVWLRMG